MTEDLFEEGEDQDLLPCPFCGSEASYGQILTGQNEGGEYIECFDCGATSRLIFPLDGDVKELLKELWNARAGLS